MVLFAEILQTIAYVLFVLITVFYIRHLDKAKKHRKLSSFESTTYVIAVTSFVLLVISAIILRFSS